MVLVVASDAAASPASCVLQSGLESGNYESDVDGDGQPDLVVGMAGYGPTGGVDVKGTRSGNHLYPGSAFPSLQASARFGASVAQVDIDRDGCDDLVIGDPGYAGGGAVDIVFGAPTGLDATRTQQVTARTGQDQYGAALSVGHYWTGDPDNGSPGPVQTDLWIGAPGRTVDGKSAAGAIDHYGLFPSGPAVFKESIDEDHLPTGAHNAVAGGRFGTVLRATEGYNWDGSYWGELLAGAPNDTVSGQPQAGRAYMFYDKADVSPGNVPPVVGATTFSERGSAPGGPEPSDHFGASVAVLPDEGLMAIGVPGEDLGRARDTGCVVLFHWLTGDEAYTPVASMLTQNSAGVPGVNESGDRFGGSLVFPFAPQRSDQPLLVGVADEDLGTIADAGSVDLLTVRDTDRSSPPLQIVAAAALTQGGHGKLGGAIEAGDRLGATVGYLLPSSARLMLIGVPGEDIGSTHDAGVVESYQPSTGAVSAWTVTGGAVADVQYGRRLTQQVNTY